jgi:hypothetical protein
MDNNERTIDARAGAKKDESGEASALQDNGSMRVTRCHHDPRRFAVDAIGAPNRRVGHPWMLVAMILLAGACGGTAPDVRPDEMSAAQHREEARRNVQAAETHERRYEPTGLEVPALADYHVPIYKFTIGVYNPTEWHLAEAERLRQHAAQHRKAAKRLEQFEASECKEFPPAARAACPLLGPVVKIEDIPGGIRAIFAAGTRVDAIVAHMRCHFAYAQARGFADTAACPLYLRGIEIRRAADPQTVEIVSQDPAAAEEVRRRSREEAVYLGEREP